MNAKRLGLLVLWGGAAALLVLAVMILPPWLDALVPRWFWGVATVAFLIGLQWLHAIVVLCCAVAVPVVFALLLRARRKHARRPALSKLLALAVSISLALVALEAGAAVWNVWSKRAIVLPEQFAEKAKAKAKGSGGDQDPPVLRTELARGDANELNWLVIGESSARGEPYHPWLSMGQIAGWQLERVLPGRKVHVEVAAKGGAMLSQALEQLAKQERRPDVIMLYCGHNEFQERYFWAREVPYYTDDFPAKPSVPPWNRALRASWLASLIQETIDKHRVTVPPPRLVTRGLVDRPACTRAERARILKEFEKQLETLLAYTKRIGALPILVIPAGNDAGYEPTRSVLAESTPPDKRTAFAERFQKARRLEKDDPEQSLAAYRTLLGQQPGFAETHFRLARLLEAQSRFAEARQHYDRARDLDAMPLRCPTDLQDVYRHVAARHGEAVLVDGPAVLHALSPNGLLDDHWFHDAQHPTLIAYTALTQNLLGQLQARHALGWPEGAAVPVIDPAECVRHFKLDQSRWAKVCFRAYFFYEQTAFIRHDPAERLAKSKEYELASERMKEGQAPEDAGIAGLGLQEPDLAALRAQSKKWSRAESAERDRADARTRAAVAH